MKRWLKENSYILWFLFYLICAVWFGFCWGVVYTLTNGRPAQYDLPQILELVDTFLNSIQ